MASRKNVPASQVRSWFAGLDKAPEGVPAPGSRGRLHPDTIAAFHKANKGMRYETASEAEKATIEVPGVVSLDKAGRKTSRTVTLTTEQARAALGHPKGKRGRFAKSDLALALTAQNSDAVADQFTK
jgi:hypothetical protein